MAENPEIGKGFQKKSKDKVLAFWKKLNNSLNSMGPLSKSISEWKKVWIDQKRYVRNKAVENTKNRKKTGGGPCKQHVFSVLEQSILDITASVAAAEGVEDDKPFGLNATKSTGKQRENNSSDEDSSSSEDSEVELSCMDNSLDENSTETAGDTQRESALPAQKTSQQTRKKINPSELLNIELDVQKEMNDNVRKGLEIQSHHYTEIEGHLKELNQGLENFQNIQNSLLKETKRHNSEIERLRKIEVDRKLILINSQIEVQNLKILAAKKCLGID
ncbi:uncharacterized protein [Eurosta solidaginis]|uniref:uncharacterized protein isoform X1 n=1 Tax=Eurosta solidaginis TaxID=178769 RepID=UPI003530BB35